MDEVVQEIVKCDFGQTARDVVKVLQDYGGMTVGKITKLVQYERIDVKNVLIVLIKHGLIDFKAANEGLEVAGDQDFKVYDIKNDQIFNRLRFGRFLTMDLKIEGEATRTLEENREILLKIIEVGSLKGTPEMTDLAKSGYIVQAEYDIQLGLQAEEDDGEEKYKLEEELKAEQEAETSDLIVDPRKFYILNTRKFIHQIRNQELKTLAAAKLDSHGSDHIKDGVGKIIVGLFLDNSNYIDKSENFENTEILSLSQIKEKLKEMYDQVAEEDKASADLIKQLYVDEIKLKANLDRIQSDSLECLKKENVDPVTGEPFYSIKVHHMVNVLQERCCEKIIEETFDTYHKRVYKILSHRGYLDENEVVRECFMPPRDVRRILNALFQEGIIETQEVPNKSGNMVSLFSTNFKKVRLQYYTKMIKMLLNCKKRLEFIRQKLNDKSMTWTLDEEEANRNAIYKLEYFCSDLERSIMIFSEF